MRRSLIKAFFPHILIVFLSGLSHSVPGQKLEILNSEALTAPVVEWNTFLGGTSYDSGSSVFVDTMGNLYVVGASYASWGSPIRSFSGSNDAFVAKLSGTGSLQWMTFLGGTDRDYGYGVTVDGAGNVFVCGYSAASWGVPIRAYSGNDDGFVVKLSASGALLWNTFLGASGFDYSIDIASDTSGNVYVTGYSTTTWGSPIRAFTPSGNDGYIAKLDGNGSLLWNTFLGGPQGDGCYGISVDVSSNAYVTGWSNSTWGSPVRPYSGNCDVLVAKVDSAGALQWNTFLGSGAIDEGWGIATDISGNVFVAGKGDDAFVAKLNSGGVLQWTTPLGGAGSDIAHGVSAAGNGDVYIVGYSSATWGSPATPFTPAPYNPFVAMLTGAVGALQWNLFLGGSNYNSGSAIMADGAGNIFVVGQSGAWGSPIRAHAGGTDAFLAKIRAVASGFTLSASPESVTVAAGQSAAYAIQVMPQSGPFDSAVTFSCSGLPRGCTATFSPASVTPGANVVASALTINTKSNSGWYLGSLHGGIDFVSAVPAILLMLLAAPFGILFRKLRLALPWHRWVTSGALLCLLIIVAACGVGKDGNQPNEGTPLGTYQISVQGQSGSVSASTTVTLVVN